MPAPVSSETWGPVGASSNGSAAEHARGRNLLADGLEDPWAVPANGKDSQQRPATAGLHAGRAAAEDWGPEPHALGRRSKSLTLDEAQSAFADSDRAQLASQPAVAEAASSRSWMKPFGRKKKAARSQEENSSLESSLSASGRATFTPAQLQRAASAGLPGVGPTQTAAQSAAAGGSTAAATADSDGGERAPTSSGRRLWSRSSEHVAGRDARLGTLSRAEPAAEVLERSKSGTEGGGGAGSRWNPFSRGGAKSAATTPTEPALLTSAQMGTDSSTTTLTAEEPSSSEASRRSSYDPEIRQGIAAEQSPGHVLSLFAGSSVPADEPKPPSDDGKKGHRRGRSLSSMLNPLKMKGRRGSTADELDLSTDARATAAAEVPQRPKTPDPAKRASSGALGCFGGGPRVEDDSAAKVVRHGDADDEQGPAMPPALVGLKNLGNTCFINAAVQCLRHTPGLALTVLPDLLTMPQVSDSEPTTPKAAAADAGGSAASSHAALLSGECRKAEQPDADGPLAAGVPLGASLQKQPPPMLGVIKATDSPVASIAAPEALQATPEDRPLMAEVKQSPPVSFSSNSHGSDSQPGAATQAAAAAVAAVPDSSLLDVLPVAASTSAAPAGAELQGNGAAAAQPAEGPAATAADGMHRVGCLHSHPIETAPSTEVDGAAAHQAASPAGPADTALQPSGGAETAEGPAAAAGEAGAQPPAAQPAPPANAADPRPPPPPLLERGELLDAFRRLVREVYRQKRGAVDPVYLVKRLGALGAALGEDFTDGGQHDCEEVLSAIIDRLHEDLNRVEPPEEPQQQQQQPQQQDQQSGAAPPATPEPAQRQHSGGSDARDPGTPATPQTPSLGRPSHRLAMAGGLGRDSAQLGFGMRSLSLSSSVADDGAEPNGETAANGDAAPAQPEERDDPNEPQDVKAERMWKRHLEQDDSPVTDLFGGQLQGNITCHGCKRRFTRYEFFKGLSLPLVREARGGLSSWFSAGKPPSSITDCLAAFTADETLRGNDNEYYSCDECKGKTAATINMRIHRFPRILMLHIKRFTYTGTTREKLTTNVAFPLKGLRLGAFASDEAGAGGDKDGGPEYDLYAVINHTGTMAGGHYVATCRVPGTKDQWHTFNDEVVVKAQASAVATANAYLLFYVRRDA